MKKLVILEGPDGAGKTTLAQELADEYRAAGRSSTIVHAGPPIAGSKEILPTMLYRALNKFKSYEVVIMDRSPMSEMIYGSVLRGEILGSTGEWRVWADVQAGKVGWYEPVEVDLLLLDASDATLLHRAYGVRGEDYVPPEKFLDIVNSYRSLYDTVLWEQWTRVITDADPDE